MCFNIIIFVVFVLIFDDKYFLWWFYIYVFGIITLQCILVFYILWFIDRKRKGATVGEREKECRLVEVNEREKATVGEGGEREKECRLVEVNEREKGSSTRFNLVEEVGERSVDDQDIKFLVQQYCGPMFYVMNFIGTFDRKNICLVNKGFYECVMYWYSRNMYFLSNEILNIIFEYRGYYECNKVHLMRKIKVIDCLQWSSQLIEQYKETIDNTEYRRRKVRNKRILKKSIKQLVKYVNTYKRKQKRMKLTIQKYNKLIKKIWKAKGCERYYDQRRDKSKKKRKLVKKKKQYNYCISKWKQKRKLKKKKIFKIKNITKTFLRNIKLTKKKRIFSQKNDCYSVEENYEKRIRKKRYDIYKKRKRKKKKYFQKRKEKISKYKIWKVANSKFKIPDNFESQISFEDDDDEIHERQFKDWCENKNWNSNRKWNFKNRKFEKRDSSEMSQEYNCSKKLFTKELCYRVLSHYKKRPLSKNIFNKYKNAGFQFYYAEGKNKGKLVLGDINYCFLSSLQCKIFWIIKNIEGGYPGQKRSRKRKSENNSANNSGKKRKGDQLFKCKLVGNPIEVVEHYPFVNIKVDKYTFDCKSTNGSEICCRHVMYDVGDFITKMKKRNEKKKFPLNSEILKKSGIPRTKENKTYWFVTRTIHGLLCKGNPKTHLGTVEVLIKVATWFYQFQSEVGPFVFNDEVVDNQINNPIQTPATPIFIKPIPTSSPFSNIFISKKRGPCFQPIHIPPNVLSGEKKVTRVLKDKMKIRIKRLMEIVSPIYNMLLIEDSFSLFMPEGLNMIIEHPLFGLKGVFKSDGTFKIIEKSDIKVQEGRNWTNDYYHKLLLSISNNQYRVISGVEGWTSLSTIYYNINKLLNKMKSYLTIIKYHEFDSKGQKVDRHAGINADPVEVLKRFISLNPSFLVDTLNTTKSELSFKKKTNPELFGNDQDKVKLFRERRKYVETNDGIKACISLGMKHDGGKSLPGMFKKKVTFWSDREDFELGSICFIDRSKPYQLSNFLFWFLVFLHINDIKLKDIAPSLYSLVKRLLKIEFELTLPVEVVDELNLDSTNRSEDGTISLNLSFCLNFCMDMYAMKLYNTQTSCSARVKITSEMKCIPYLKEGIKLEDAIDNPSVDNVRSFDNLYSVFINTALLRKDPFRDDLNIPFEFLSRGNILDWVDKIVDVETDNLHGCISIQRIMLKFYEKIVRLFITTKLLKKEFLKHFYKLFIKQFRIYKYHLIYGTPGLNEIGQNFEKKFNMDENRNTVKATHFYKLFDKEMVSTLFNSMKDFMVNNQEEFDVSILDTTANVLKELSEQAYEFLFILMKENKLFDKKKEKEVGFHFDHIYIFFVHCIQISPHHSDYILDLLSTLPLDIYFKRSINKNGTSPLELLVKIVKKLFSGNSSRFKKFGLRKLCLSILGSDAEEILDVFSNSAVQIMMSLFAKTGNAVFGDPKVEVKVTEYETYIDKDLEKIHEVKRNEDCDISFLYGEDIDYLNKLKSFYETCQEWLKLIVKLKKEREEKINFLKPFTPESMQRLYQHQIGIIQTLRMFYDNKENMLLAWYPGTGKSLPCIHFATMIINNKTKRFSFIVAVNNMVPEWISKVDKWDDIYNNTHHTTVVNDFKGFIKLNSRTKGKIVIINYGVLRKIILLCLDYKQKVDNYNSSRSELSEEGNTAKVLLETMINKNPGLTKCLSLWEKVAVIFYDELHIKLQKNEKFKDFIKCFSKMKEVLSLNCIHVVVTGSPFRNESTFLHICSFLSDKSSPDISEETKIEIEKKLDVIFRTRSYSKLAKLIPVLRKMIQRKIFIQYPELECKLYNIIVEVPATRKQIKKLPDQKPQVGMVIDFDRIALSPFALTKSQWQPIYKKRKKLIKQLEKTKAKGIVQKLSRSQKKERKKVLDCFDNKDSRSYKLDVIIEILEAIYNNRVDKGYAKMLLEKEEDDDNNDNGNGNDTNVETNSFDEKRSDLIPQLESISKSDSESESKSESKSESESKSSEDFIVPVQAYEKVIICSSHVFLLQQLQVLICKDSSLINDSMIFHYFGEDSNKVKNEQLNLWRSSQFGILLLSTTLAGVGLTLTEARYMIQLEAKWDHTWNFQCLFREYRYTQLRDVYNFIILLSNKKNGEDVNTGQMDVFSTSAMKDVTSRLLLSKHVNMIECEDEQILDSVNDTATEIFDVFEDYDCNYYTYSSVMIEMSKKVLDKMEIS